MGKHQKKAKSESPNLVILRNKACSAIGEYLKANGWETVENTSDTGFLQVIDPRHGNSHRPDFAFIIQSDRDLAETYQSWLKSKK